MAQLENGYLKIANEIISVLQKTQMSNSETRVLLTVFRHTYGWNKKVDSISLSQFEKETGLTRRGVCKAIGSLVSKCILGREQKGTTSITSYWYQKDCKKWRPIGNKKALAQLGNKQVSAREQTGQMLGNKKAPTKDIITKDNIQKTVEAKTPQARFLESFSGLYENQTGQPFKADKKHYVLISNLIKKYGYEATAEKAKLLAVYCQQGEVWFCKNGWSDFTPEKLSAQWNSIIPIKTEDQKKQEKANELNRKMEEHERKINGILKGSA